MIIIITILLIFLIGLSSVYFLSNFKRRHTLFGRILTEFMIAVIIWIVIATWLLALQSTSLLSRLGTLIWLTMVPYGFLLFMINLYWLLRETEKRDRKRILFYSIRLIAIIILCSPLFSIFFSIDGQNVMEIQTYLFFLLVTTIVSISMAGLVYQDNKQKIYQLISLRKALGKSAADLQFLRSQINPHFLFNALNTIYGIAIRENAAKTGEGIQKLGDMMRFMLQNNQKDKVALASEINYLKDYVYMQQLRLAESDNILIEININEPSKEYFIAPMLLIPFVENAFKHGIRLQEKSWICIELNYNNNYLKYKVRNSLHNKTGRDTEHQQKGIGLENVKERLELLYPEKYSLTINKNKVEFIINLSLILES